MKLSTRCCKKMSNIPHRWSTIVLTASGPRYLFPLSSRSRYRFCTKIEINDIVLLKKKSDDTAKPILTKQLRPTEKVEALRSGDSIDHASLIGREIRDIVSSKKGLKYRIHQPSLAEYVTLSPRIVTPVYPADANLIVSLLDIHPPKIQKDHISNGPFEIFEAGTGNGALTLYLARAIHGLNPSPPPLPSVKPVGKSFTDKAKPENPNITSSNETTSSMGAGELVAENLDISGSGQATQLIDKLTLSIEQSSAEEVQYESYLHSRQAVIHTLDISPIHSKFAQRIVRNFRRGLYYHNIDFHVGTIPEYLSSRFMSTPKPFLEHAILDLPNLQEHIEIVGQALKPNGFLVVFCPSITQIVDCVKHVRGKALPFLLESVLELGEGTGVGGKEWNITIVKPKAVRRAEDEARNVKEQNESASKSNPTGNQEDLSAMSLNKDSEWVTVCRPKVGVIVRGGGFLGLWRRMRVTRPTEIEPVPTPKTEATQIMSDPKNEI